MSIISLVQGRRHADRLTRRAYRRRPYGRYDVWYLDRERIKMLPDNLIKHVSICLQVGWVRRRLQHGPRMGKCGPDPPVLAFQLTISFDTGISRTLRLETLRMKRDNVASANENDKLALPSQDFQGRVVALAAEPSAHGGIDDRWTTRSREQGE
jgi:hypothetical protein